MSATMTREPVHIDAAEVARLIRAALKRSFPSVRFSIRTSRYSMGASIDISWLDGPSREAVEAITSAYRGRGDMDITDYSGYNYHWLMPDGTSVLHRGNVGNYGGSIDGAQYAIGARLVTYGAHYIDCTRRVSR